MGAELPSRKKWDGKAKISLGCVLQVRGLLINPGKCHSMELPSTGRDPGAGIALMRS